MSSHTDEQNKYEEFHNQSHARNMQAIKLFRLTCGIAVLVPIVITIIYLITR